MIKTDPDPAHKRMYDSRQLGLKIVANSVYGMLSASGGWFVKMEMGESVTSWGRSMIHKAMSIAKTAPFNADIIYGDTDSLMMVFPGCTTVPDAFERLKKVCDAITAAFPKPIAMAAEKVYEGHLQFGKKRYAGFCHIPPGNPKIDSKGVEKNRLDNTPLVRRMMAKIFNLLLVDENVEGALKYVHDCVADLVQGKIDFSDLVITKSISKLEYKGRTVHVEVAKRMKARDPSYPIAPGERIPYVIVKAPGTRVFEKAEDPLWSIQHDMEIDVDHYIKDISRPLARTLMWYTAPKEMLDEIKATESRISEICEKDPGTEAELEKSLKKQLEKMTDFVAKQLFGLGALSDIRRPPQKRVGPITKFLAPVPKKVRSTPADAEHLESLRSKLLEAKSKCTKCRDREDDTVACVQRDCANLFRVALFSKDIEELLK
jgi:DNA polymerase elongation subunit (family B)